ncbi:hypothetical protein U1Q18_020913 [Sarracenia purpurea var. burkii]
MRDMSVTRARPVLSPSFNGRVEFGPILKDSTKNRVRRGWALGLGRFFFGRGRFKPSVVGPRDRAIGQAKDWVGVGR